MSPPMPESPLRDDGRNDARITGATPPPRPAVRILVRDDGQGPPPAATCLLCTAPRLSGRGRYCSAACRQRAFRLRHTALPAAEEDLLRKALQRRKQLTEHTIYECPSCEAQYLGERRCAECNRFCRARGLGGACSACAEPVLLSDLLDLEV